MWKSNNTPCWARHNPAPIWWLLCLLTQHYGSIPFGCNLTAKQSCVRWSGNHQQDQVFQERNVSKKKDPGLVWCHVLYWHVEHMHTFRTSPMENFGSPCMVCIFKDKFFIFCWHVCAPKSDVAGYRSETKEQLFIPTPLQEWLLDTVGELILGFGKSSFIFSFRSGPQSSSQNIYLLCAVWNGHIFFSGWSSSGSTSFCMFISAQYKQL